MVWTMVRRKVTDWTRSQPRSDKRDEANEVTRPLWRGDWLIGGLGSGL